MKTPPRKMTKPDLIDWIMANDARDYYVVARANVEHLCNAPGELEEVLPNEVYDLIWDDVNDGRTYKQFILEDDDE